jgi:protein-S-isoprenylcysteine O-methyltransferase Ste14
VEPPGYFTLLWLVTLAGVFSPFGDTGAAWTYLGAVPAAAGVLLNLWTDKLLKEHSTTVKPDEAPSSLITSGPFALSRNPMYLGMALILFGTAMMTGCMLVSVTAPAFMWLVDREFIHSEEANMKRAFGREYERYASRVRRWI